MIGRILRWSLGTLLLVAVFGSPLNPVEKTDQARAAEPRESFNLILPFTDVSVGQGQEFTMDAEVFNRTKDPVQVALTVDGVPKGWEVGFHSRYPSYPIRSVMVQGEKSTTMEFKAKLPDAAKPGTYEVRVTAKDEAGRTSQVEKIVLRVGTKKVETGGLKLTSQYPVLSGATGQTFKFNVDLKNETKKPLTVGLRADAPPGWVVRFKPRWEDTQISSIAVKEDSSETLAIEIDSPIRGEPKEYPITIQARAGAFEATTNLKVALRGTHDLKMGTLSGTLNTSITAGTKSTIDFLVANAGTAPVRNLSFVTKKPEKWTIDFKPEKIDALDAGEVREIKMEILAPRRTVTGDYLLTLTANSPETSRSVEFRVTVSTPTLWGWVGAGIVGAVILGLGVVFVRLGRR